MRTLIAPNGMKIVYNDSDEQKVQCIIKKAQEIFDAKTIKREEKQKEYFLRVRARYEALEAKMNAEETKAEEAEEANLNSGTDEQVSEAV